MVAGEILRFGEDQPHKVAAVLIFDAMREHEFVSDADALFSAFGNVEQCTVLGTFRGSDYYAATQVRQASPFLRQIVSRNASLQDNGVALLEEGVVVDGFHAAIFSECQFRAIKTRMYVSLLDPCASSRTATALLGPIYKAENSAQQEHLAHFEVASRKCARVSGGVKTGRGEYEILYS